MDLSISLLHPSLPCSALLCGPRRLPYAWHHQGLPTPAFQLGRASPHTGRRQEDRRGVRSRPSFSSFLPCQVLTDWPPPQGHNNCPGTLTELLVSPWENSFLSLLIRHKAGNGFSLFLIPGHFTFECAICQPPPRDHPGGRVLKGTGITQAKIH